MSKSWLDTKDQPLLVYAQNWVTRITATPVAYNCAAGDATALSSLFTPYSTSLAAATNPSTRTSITIAQKDIAKAALIAQMRFLYKKMNAGNLSADKRQELGLPIRDADPSPISAPTTRPVTSLLHIAPLAITARAKDELTQEKKAKPFGCEGLQIFTWVGAPGANPPADLRSWSFVGIAKKSDFTVTYDPADANKIAHIRTLWYNSRGHAGAPSDPITATIAA